MTISRGQQNSSVVYTLSTGMEGTVTGLLQGWGHNPDEHFELIQDIAAAAYEEACEVVKTMLREAGLHDETL